MKEYQVKNGGRYDRGRPEFKLHSFIPIEFLKLVTKDINSNTEFQEESDSDSDNSYIKN